jgi:NitT/TauT family transport system substrate-binding protein
MKFRTGPALAAIGLVLSIAACGSGGSGGAPAAADCPEPTETTRLTVGILPIIDSAAFQVAQDQGFFEDEHLEVEGQIFTAGTAVIAAVLSGDVQIGWAAINGSFNGLSQNTPIVSVASGAYSDVGENDSGGIVVAGGSGIRSIADLQGRTVSIIAQQSLAHLEVMAALDANGVDPASVTYVEIGFGDIPAAVQAGRIDAGLTQEPFTSLAVNQGLRIAGHPVSEIFGGPTQLTEWLTSEQFAGENPCAVQQFQRAINRANEYAQENPDAARAAIRTLIPSLDAALVEQVTLPVWRGEVDRSSYETVLGLMRTYAGFTAEPDLGTYLRLTEQT